MNFDEELERFFDSCGQDGRLPPEFECMHSEDPADAGPGITHVYERPPAPPRMWGASTSRRCLGSAERRVKVPHRGKRKPRNITEDEFHSVQQRIDGLSATPESDQLKMLLPMRAGLRPCEVAALQRRTLVDATGEVLEYITVLPGTTKRGRLRKIPMHPEIRTALLTLFEKYPKIERIAFDRGSNGVIRYCNAHTLTGWYRRVYTAVGLEGVTGMSGRHTFATECAMKIGSVGCTIRNVQELLGHANLATTSWYVKESQNSADLIKSLGVTR